MSTGKSKAGRDELTVRVQQALNLPTKKEAEHIINVVVSALENTLLHNLATNGFQLKLNSFGKFSVRHKAGIYRKMPLVKPVQMRMTKAKRKIKFVTLGDLRKQETVK